MCKIPPSFSKFRETLNTWQLPPYKLYPYKVVGDDFKAQLYFYDSKTKSTKMIFLTGKIKVKE